MTDAARHCDLIEELAANAWPAAIMQQVDGWRLRCNGGATRRANSVLPNADSGRLPLDVKLRVAEEFYARHNQPLRFQISPANQPPKLDGVLAGRGYAIDARSVVQTAPVACVQRSDRSQAAFDHTVSAVCDEAWFAAYCASESVDPAQAGVRRHLFDLIGPAAAFITLRLDQIVAAIGLGVAERSFVGAFCIATLPQFQRRGAATAVMQALAQWGQQHGADQMYVQVVERNTAARALYERLGFQTAYSYWYRERTTDDSETRRQGDKEIQ